MVQSNSTYLSQKARESIQKRKAIVKRRKIICVVISTLIICIGIILGSTISAMAKSSHNEIIEKKYISVQMKSGDTLWDFAKEYTDGSKEDMEAYIKEICSINALNDDSTIHAGQYLLIIQYQKY